MEGARRRDGEAWKVDGEGKESGLKLTNQCCSYYRLTAISEPSCVDCHDNNTIVSAWDEARQHDHLSTH